jgi:ABC-type glycerol-3-phosphate transport system permease component
MVPLALTLFTSFADPAWVKEHYQGQARALWTADLRLTFAQYGALLQGAAILPTLLTTFAYAALTTLLHLGGSLVVAFALTKVKARGNGLLSVLYLVGMALPAQALLLPCYVVLHRLGLGDHWASLYLTAIFAPFGVFFLRQAMATMPDSLLEAALLETSGVGTLLFHIVLPSVQPSMIAMGALAFSDAWNAVEQPMILLGGMQVQPIALRLVNMVRDAKLETVFAYAVLAVLPMGVLYCMTRKHLFAAMENFRF